MHRLHLNLRSMVFFPVILHISLFLSRSCGGHNGLLQNSTKFPLSQWLPFPIENNGIEATAGGHFEKEFSFSHNVLNGTECLPIFTVQGNNHFSIMKNNGSNHHLKQLKKQNKKPYRTKATQEVGRGERKHRVSRHMWR